MYTIGEFSKITGLTVKTLRFYHEQGLLVPSAIDEQTGYRFYSAAKIETARAIAYLRSLDLPLSEIGEILRLADDDADLLEVMERHRDLIVEKMRRLRKVEASLGQFIVDAREARRIMANASFEVQERVLEPVLVAGVRMRGRYSDCGKGFAKIGKRHGRHICGKAMLLHYDQDYHEDDADYEACLPVRRGVDGDGIVVKQLPGGRCIALMHKGPYEQMGSSYAKILNYIRGKGLDIVMPTREVYHTGPGMIFRGNPKKYLTEIQILIRTEQAGEGSTFRE